MTTLKIFIEGRENSWTLKPDREYIIGSGGDCHISFPEEEIANQQLKFKFDYSSNRWYVENLDQSHLAYFNNEPLTEYSITNECNISIGNQLFFVATPEDNKADYSINKNFLDEENPEELRGFWLKSFSFSFNKKLALKDKSDLENVTDILYKGVNEKLQEYKTIDPYFHEGLNFRIINYKDEQYKNDRDRLYLQMEWETIRKTQITTMLRFFLNGDNLYIANDFYALGRINKISLGFHLMILAYILLFLIIPFLFFIIFLVPWLILSGIQDLANGGLFLSILLPILLPNLLYMLFLMILLTIAIWYLYFRWIKFIKALFNGKSTFKESISKRSIIHALQVNFPQDIQSNTFDLDDTYMFIKSIYPLVISSLEETLGKDNMLGENERKFFEFFKENIKTQTITVNTGGGGIIGSVIGGGNNTMNNQS